MQGAMVICFVMSHSLGPFRNGSWRLCILFLLLFIVARLVGVELIGQVGFHQRTRFLRWSYYNCLPQGSPCPFKWKSVLRVNIPPKVAFFKWTAAKGRIFTMDNLCSRKFCARKMLLVDHLLLHCEFTSQLWSLVFCLFGLHWTMPGRVVDMLAC